MLKLKNVCKYYRNGKEKKIILDNITLDFNKNELVFILGASGSGKSTLLNIIGGNLKCDSGDILLGDSYVSKFNDKELDNYRGNVIGNIFQDYNLIEYMSVYDNVMLGYNDGIDKKDVDILLKQLGIYDKKKMPVSKLSGGEKQRVAIVRALINDPEIILADEPTGALDSKTGIEVMEILKKISLNKLVIVVSHDNYLANKYASRIINIKDGKCEYLPIIQDGKSLYNVKKKKNKLFSIMKLAFKNLWLKRVRTIFTSLAISLGIISMFLVINLYSNFSTEIVNLEKEVVSVFPITVSNGDFEVLDNKEVKSNNKIILKDMDKWIHTNKINQKYLNYLSNIKNIKYLTYSYDISMPIVSDTYKFFDNSYLSLIPSYEYIDDNYNILYGRNIENSYEILLKVDSNNNVSSELLKYFDITNDIEYNEIIGRKIKIILNNQYYVKNGNYYIINSNIEKLYETSDIELSIVGVIKEKNEVDNNSCIYYNKDLLDIIFNLNSNSNIVKDQISNDYNVLGLNMGKNEMLSYLGYNSLPNSINIYVDNLEDKEQLIRLLDKYNEENQELVYVDTMASAIDIVREFISIISIILILFSVVAIIISSLMIGILTNVRVLERKKEIGIFRSLGASKKDIRKLFNIENIMIGIVSLVISLIIIILMVDPINNIMNNYLDMDNIFTINYVVIIVVFLVNILIIKMSGSIPARRASKMEIVTCIYNR